MKKKSINKSFVFGAAGVILQSAAGVCFLTAAVTVVRDAKQKIRQTLLKELLERQNCRLTIEE